MLSELPACYTKDWTCATQTKMLCLTACEKRWRHNGNLNFLWHSACDLFWHTCLDRQNTRAQLFLVENSSGHCHGGNKSRCRTHLVETGVAARCLHAHLFWKEGPFSDYCASTQGCRPEYFCCLWGFFGPIHLMDAKISSHSWMWSG